MTFVVNILGGLKLHFIFAGNQPQRQGFDRKLTISLVNIGSNIVALRIIQSAPK